MAGFLGLGGSSESYFLEPDDAKSFGDIEYMRTPKKVKRTFAKTRGWGDVGASEKTVSAYDERGGAAAANGASSGYQSYTPPAPSSYTPSTPTYTPPVQQASAAQSSEPSNSEEVAPAPAPRPASSGDGMDMFRAMAKKMR